ncbi:helix-turn-helix domain-containing protein [Marinimicrococcus flavescens]|uniref:Helix-turn-helix transcriptional regulator n=1 Tax=Marinimicrococcus flavescens TaxID=3031815 RepID=A0AAP3XPK7_9PROT|nr:helix-turn-helix transcriptional regulator [Marinimicrococcus flavescens]
MSEVVLEEGRPAGAARGEAHPVDVEVGRRLRDLRALRGISQEELARSLGIAFQQVQKYERGQNRIGASRLVEIAHILGVPASDFLSGIVPPPAAGQAPGPGLAEGGAPGFVYDDPSMARGRPAPVVDTREALELVRAFGRIHDPLVRRRFFELAKMLGQIDYATPPAASGAAAPSRPQSS